jgi:hypothetical protein
MVGQNQKSAEVAQKIDETHTAALGEFDLAKKARLDASAELVELKAIAREIRLLLDK